MSSLSPGLRAISLPTVATGMHNAAGFPHRILEFAKSGDRQAQAAKELPVVVFSEAIWHDLFFLIVFGRP
jgi:hypothetical protein